MKYGIAIVDFRDMSVKVIDIHHDKKSAEDLAFHRNAQYEATNYKRAFALPMELLNAGDPKRFI